MKTAMILAAGRGERLRPLTDKIPKALCTVRNKPLIEHHIINLANAGFERLVINHAYLGGQIRQYIGNGKQWGLNIIYSPEPPGGLETGGGIVKALPLLGDEPFLTVNADIYTDFDFAKLQLKNIDTLHLILIPKNPSLLHHGDFGLINESYLTNTNQAYTFSGIACYNPKVFANCRQGRYSVTPLLRKYVEQNKATGSVHSGIWYDIGSFDRLQAANQFI
ncbi:N-acetylmuramate alpha-1-phosphate uridylyltransferase MurU [Legionella pneumophila]|uniref:N-acetylmuramate alpha-1-phosphate uridylyltransferase MurU n=1 Tax=Legionella pneumophila TaxID=446 RepID=UPI00048DABC2|nr:nucleotidyltransferase family protein [Legionella pneumophila]RYB34525.1 nucleotidyltransferase family protein [Legionella pneumophila]RYW23475.1 nucleotidyltransferase family protein [Legionella pneumophila]HAT1868846.1 nucleotidyltransferase family protein [Legionella pneumophila]HAT1908916.1 nucleotidyltransferase family protein [Legionella pneumophila]HAT1918127.1 nucleotidyltransferase family protein [Legionella pneumophila]